MPATDGDDVQHAITWNTDRENCVAEVAVHVADMLRRRDLCRHYFPCGRSKIPPRIKEGEGGEDEEDERGKMERRRRIGRAHV